VAQAHGTGLNAAAQRSQTAPAESRSRRLSAVLGDVPRRYFDEAAAVAASVFGASPAIERSYLVGGLRCRVRYGDERVQSQIHPSLAHLELPASAAGGASAADLRIGVWDEANADVLLPAPEPRMFAAVQQYLDICSDDRYLALEEQWLGTSSYVDRQAGVAWHCVRNASALPGHERAAPLRCVLNALLVSRGRHLVHASAVGTAEGGVLLVGPPASGKSSSALACLGGRLGYLADGWCGVRQKDENGDGDGNCGGGAPELFSVYAAAKLLSGGLDRFAELRAQVDAVDDVDGGKSTILLAERWPSALLRGCPAKAILIPEVTGAATTSIAPTTQMAAWRALVPWTLSYLAGCGRASTELLTRQCARLPAFRLGLGRDRQEVRAALEDFVTRL
jgi:hypothetical protein